MKLVWEYYTNVHGAAFDILLNRLHYAVITFLMNRKLGNAKTYLEDQLKRYITQISYEITKVQVNQL